MSVHSFRIFSAKYHIWKPLTPVFYESKHSAVNKCCKIIEICKYETPRCFLRVFHRTFSLYFWTAFLYFCVFVFVSPECPPLYYFAREHWWYCVTVFLRTDWLNVSLLLFQIWYLANWIFRSLFPNTQGAVTRFNPYEFLDSHAFQWLK